MKIVSGHHSRRILSAVLLLLLFTGLLSGDVAVSGTAPRKVMRRLINEERVAHSVPPVSLRPRLNQLAREHSLEMAARGSLFHSTLSLVRQKLGGLVFAILGENVGVGRNVPVVHEAFMNSPPHRENVLRSVFDFIGVGVVRSGGLTWVTVLFAGG
jgi:uncharacterized protein YkwD